MQSLRFLFAFVLAFVATQLNAQIYVIDSQWPDSVVAHTYKRNPDRSAEVEDMTTIKLAQGDTIKVLRALEGNPTIVAFKRDGKHYSIRTVNILFASNNAEGVEDLYGT